MARFLEDVILRKLQHELSKKGEDRLIRDMYGILKGLERYSRMKFLLRYFLDDSTCRVPSLFDAKSRRNFGEWLWGIFEDYYLAEEKRFENFKAGLMSSEDYMILCFELYYCLCFSESKYPDLEIMKPVNADTITINLYEEDPKNILEVHKMDKVAAISQSELFNGLIDSTGGRDGIPVSVDIVSGDILSKVISFCEKKHDFHNLFKSVVDRYKAWITGFLNTNQAILSGLHQAADFLNIPSLLDLTSQAVGDMRGKALEEISEWYTGFSIPRILSSLGVGQEVRNQGVGPWAFG